MAGHSNSAPVSRDALITLIGHRLRAILAPVLLAVSLVMWSVSNLSPLNASASAMARAYSPPDDGQSTVVEKLTVSVFFAAIFVLGIMAVTFAIVFLYQHRLTVVVYIVLAISAVNILTAYLWLWLDLFFTRFQIPYDVVTMSLCVWNITVVGLFSLFYYGHPTLNQTYLVVVSAVVAWVMSALPSWITWTLLVAMSLYDLFAVLSDVGPLRKLIALSSTRREPLPGFIYDSEAQIRRLQPAAPVAATQADVRPDDTSSVTGAVSRSWKRFAHVLPPFKLGLGDFVFYSLLVGRATMSGYLSAMFCLITILAGMVGTMILLLVLKDGSHGLPALPISILAAVLVFLSCWHVVAVLDEQSASVGMIV